MNPLTIYLVGIADNVGYLLRFLAVVVAGLIIFSALYYSENKKENIYWKKLTFSWVIVVISAFTIPSTNLLATMIVLPQIAESKAIKEDLPEIYEIAISALKDKLKKE